MDGGSTIEDVRSSVASEEARRDSAGMDRGQPTSFYPRRQQFVFGVTVPEDFGNKALVWTLRRGGDGAPQTAVGKLDPVWVWSLTPDIWRGNRGGSRSEDETNQRPRVEDAGGRALTVGVGRPVALTVRVADDGRPAAPEPSVRGEGGTVAVSEPLPNDLPSIRGSAGEPNRQAVVSAAAARQTGMGVTWVHYRGPGTVIFDPQVVAIPNDGGTASTTARFMEAGTHEVRAYADDGLYIGSVGITVRVEDAR
jgi:hypothetical protein